MERYRQPYLEPSSREPLYRFPNEVPVAGRPADVAAMVEAYHEWLLESEVPKLFFYAAPGARCREDTVKYYRERLKNVRVVNVPGRHWIQEDDPHLIGKELAEWTVRAVLGGDGGKDKKDTGVSD